MGVYDYYGCLLAAPDIPSKQSIHVVCGKKYMISRLTAIIRILLHKINELLQGK